MVLLRSVHVCPFRVLSNAVLRNVLRVRIFVGFPLFALDIYNRLFHFIRFIIISGADCIQFPASIVGSCFCNQALTKQGESYAVSILYQSGSNQVAGSSATNVSI